VEICGGFWVLGNESIIYFPLLWRLFSLLEKLTVNFAASQEIPRIYGTRKSLTVPTSARHLSLSWANSIQSPRPPSTSWRSILILSSHLPYRHPEVLQTVKPRAIPESLTCFWKILKLLSYSVLKINLHILLRDTWMPLIFSGTLFSNFHAFAYDVRCFELTFEIRLSIPRFGKPAVSNPLSFRLMHNQFALKY
jgi:hypothetical protein